MSEFSYREKNNVIAGVKATQENSEKSLKLQMELLEAFQRVARSLDGLTAEIKGLRDDLNPKLDKPAKFPAPAASAGGQP